MDGPRRDGRAGQPRPAARPDSLDPPRPDDADREWEDLLLASFGARHWNLGCG